MRHRIKIFDAGFIIVILSVAALFAFEADIFENENRLTQHQETVELDELLVLTTLAVSGILFYTWRRAREHKRENRLRMAAEKEVLSLAMHDPLTGLPNRRQFDHALRSALAALPTAPEAHAILLLDLNGFKKINDVHGHPIGDQVLIHVGSRLLRAVREGDLVARLGGDEFAILARNLLGAEAAAGVGLRILECLTEPVIVDGVRHQVGTSIGIALSPQDSAGAEELLRKADVALYRAKAEGRAGLRFFEPAMDRRLHERDAMEQALIGDLKSDAFVVRYQPVATLDGSGVTRFEALPRWRHSTLGELEPERFVPIAEEAGVLADLTEDVLAQSCRTAAQWPPQVRLAFNLPSALLHDTAFGLRIQSVLAQTGFSPTRLALEIDEGALIREPEAAEALIRPLRKAGISIVADHFGTGYSDLKNLQRLQIDGVKIDRTFVDAMTRDRKAAVMVKALIGVGLGLDLSVIADGVQTEEQRAALAAEGCVTAQGDLYGGVLDPQQTLALFGSAPTSRPRARAAS